MSKKPNILILMADQMSAPFLPFYGDSPLKMPTLSRLAAEGVLFTSAYSNSPLCAPARFSLQSGCLPSKIGAYDNAAEFKASTPTMAHYLRIAGYRTILSGKMHFAGPDQLHGHEERLSTDIYPADFGWTPDWTDFPTRPTWYHSLDSVLTSGPTVRTNQIDFDEEVVFTARRKLYDIARDNDDRPFFMTVSLTHPHDPYAIHQKYWDRYDGVEIPLPKVRREDVDQDPHSERLRHVCDLDAEPVTDAMIERTRRAYFGSCSFVDDQFAAVLETLEECGLADDTIVVVCGDHGDMLGERGLWYKMHYFEHAARIPMIIHAPSRFAAKRVDTSVSLIDIAPTLLELAGVSVDPALPFDGRSLVPHCEGTGGHDEVIGEYMGEGTIAPLVMIRRGPWKFIHSRVDPDMLFNLIEDPLEKTNRAADPALVDIVAAFHTELAERWDFDAITRDVIASQRTRRVVGEANAIGKITHWDHNPPRDAGEDYVRAHMDLEELEAMARYPRVRF